MAHYPTQPARALALLGALLFFAACAPDAAVSAPPTATATTARAPTALPTVPPPPTSAPAPTPTNVPAGWSVLVGPHFSLAYPPGWTIQGPVMNSGASSYYLGPPTPHDQGVSVTVFQVSASIGSDGMAPYCFGPGQQGVGRVRLAGLSMAYIFGAGEGAFMRSWTFVNAGRIEYTLDALDAHGTRTDQAQDDRILATFRPDSADPWRC